MQRFGKLAFWTSAAVGLIGLVASACSGPALAVDIDDPAEAAAMDAPISRDATLDDRSSLDDRVDRDATRSKDADAKALDVQDELVAVDARSAMDASEDVGAEAEAAPDAPPTDGMPVDVQDLDAPDAGSDAMIGSGDASDSGHGDDARADAGEDGAGGGEGGATDGSGPPDSSPVDTGADTPATTLYTIGGSISGLEASDYVKLRLVAGGMVVDPSFTSTSNGTFAFPQAFSTNTAYAVALVADSANNPCTVSNGTGTVHSADVTTVVVDCAASTGAVQISGVVYGLTFSSLSVEIDNQNNGDTASAQGGNPATFTLQMPVMTGQSYALVPNVLPSGFSCLPLTISGTVPPGMAPTFYCGYHTTVQISGLAPAASVTITEAIVDDGPAPPSIQAQGTNGALNVTLSPLGPGQSAMLTTSQVTGSSYPESCATITNPSATSIGSVTDGSIVCGPPLSVSVTGAPVTVTCTNGETDALPLALTSPGTGVFATPIPAGAGYDVTCSGTAGHVCAPAQPGTNMGQMPPGPQTVYLTCN